MAQKKRQRVPARVRLPPKSRRVDVTRAEFESLRGTTQDVLSLVQRLRKDLDSLFSKMADLRAEVTDLRAKIRY
jgi:hypothetical protein